jgi:signal-transduction protein with cAMP-binding, CBS, and nucleotidyltransferase domain/predicted metal-dependent phosphoesterase TrpH
METTRVNFHCHSLYSSDGELTPEALADNLAAAGVRFAALTDHDSVEGLPRFQEALKRRGMGYVPGVELTAQCDGLEMHVLGFGFDVNHPELKATLFSLRQAHESGVLSIADSLRKAGTRHPDRAADQLTPNAAPNGLLEIGAAIALIHRAGGRAFLAHPHVYDMDAAALEALLIRLKALALDGLEAIYESSRAEQRAQLLDLAQRHGLLASAGTDVHTAGGTTKPIYGIDMPLTLWKPFRDAICASGAFINPLAAQAPSYPSTSSVHTPAAMQASAYRRRDFVLRIFLPALLAIALFVVAIWGLIIPSFERALLDRKREMIRELTNSAWSILASYERDERAGTVTRTQAQQLAMSRIQALRYGPDGKDYFWLQDMHPRIIMHPYRPDLNGQDVSTFTDPRGVRIFVEFADLVRRKQAGYIEYVWQWLDDPQRLVPKESYVKGFEPWGWIIGTGLYIDDVQREIAGIEQSLIIASLAISGGVILLLLFVVQQSLRIERERRDVEESLRESTERYRSLVEATTEGALLVLDQRCRYANPTLLEMLGCNMRQLELLDLPDVLPREDANATAWARIAQAGAGANAGAAAGAGELSAASGAGFEGVLQRIDGRRIECVMALNPISFGGSAGFILLAKDVVTPVEADRGTDGALRQVAQTAPLGLFRARAARRGVFLEMNATAQALMHGARPADDVQLALADLFDDAAVYAAFFDALQKEGAVQERIVHLETVDARARTLALSATLVRDEHGRAAYIDGALKDVTDASKHDAEREALIEKLQTSLLFLHETVGRMGRDVVKCGLDTPIHKVAALMTASNSTAALVVTDTGAAIGIVTDHDLRERVVAENLDSHAPAHAVMSAPLVSISEHALIYEALMRMEEKGVQHLAVSNEDGQVVGVVNNKELIQFQRYGATVLTREIARASSPEEVARCCERTPEMVRVLVESGARARNITRMLSAICDAAVERFIALAIAELGAPPTPFAFIAMGSHGRQEQTLLTDQDNAIIFDAANIPPGENEGRVADYFLRLGSKVCVWLEQAGYPACRGKFMASNPRWCRPLAHWKQYFTDWIVRAEPQELLQFSIFFDFRTVYGDAAPAQELRRHIHAVLGTQPAFFPHLARNALLFAPPFRVFGNIYLGGGSAEHAGQLNLKDTVMAMVDFARLYALQHQVDHTHTLDRIDALVERKVLLPASRDEAVASYDFLMRLRLQDQLAAQRAGQPMDNTINPRHLRHMEETQLRQALAQIAALQKKINYDFFGAAALGTG